jgi:uncharacterized membrane protein YraQ (UPF0718 family)
VLETLIDIVRESLRAASEAAPFLLVGLVVAGLVHEFLDTGRIVRALGGRNLRSILTATFLGAPLPLCSCGVLPAAVSLRRKGASREATVAFLISTPETGMDSIALTYGLLGPWMAIARPVAAMATAVAAGLLSLFQPAPVEPASAGEASDCEDAHDHAVAGSQTREPLLRRARRGIGYGLVVLLDDLTFWLVIGFLVTGVVAATLPSDFFVRVLPRGVASLFLMGMLGMPTYVCASASTPVAAAMLAKGLSPGAALVFMLTGPATNASTMGMIGRLFGRRFILTYVAAVFGVAIACGWWLNLLLPSAPAAPGMAVGHEAWSWIQVVCGVTLVALIGRNLQRTWMRHSSQERKTT